MALLDAAGTPVDRFAMWTSVVDNLGYQRCAEFGVFEGEFAEVLLRKCEGIREYFMIDPWRHLEDWNKPLNQSDSKMEVYYRTAMEATEFARDRRTVLRGTTLEVIDELPGSLDFAYVDGDHSLRGIAIDLINIWPKMRAGGLIAGDDLTPKVWQHDRTFEPSLVFPFTVYFAMAMKASLYALPHSQFALVVDNSRNRKFEFIDTTGGLYSRVDLLSALHISSPIRALVRSTVSRIRAFRSGAHHPNS